MHIDLAIAKGAITRYAKIDRFVTVTALPKMSVGKIEKKRLVAQFGVAGRGGSGSLWGLANEGQSNET